MHSENPIILDFLLASFITVLAITSIFSFLRISRLILVNAIVMILFIVPHRLYQFQLIDASSLSYAIIIAFIYPIAYSSMMFGQLTFKKRKLLLIPAIAGSVSFFVYYSFFQFNQLIVIMLIVTFIYISYVLIPEFREITNRIFLVMMLAASAYLLFKFKTINQSDIILSMGILSLSSICIIAYNLKKRVTILLQHFTSLVELNTKLNHKITRFKHNGEQLKNLIIEKDYELLQISRHASLAELTTGIAHELLQPLTGIKGIAQNMIDDINYEEFENLQAVSELMKISSLVDKSSSIINHIKDFSRKNIISKKPLELNVVILEAIDLIKLQLKKNNIDLIFVLDETIPKIFGDKIALEQLILNLVLNSRDAIIERMALRDYPGIIRLSTFSEGSFVYCRVEDNGGGISDDIIKKIWHPFFTTKKKYAGTGIGLSISQRIIKDHNAEIHVESDERGTIFTITFIAER